MIKGFKWTGWLKPTAQKTPMQTIMSSERQETQNCIYINGPINTKDAFEIAKAEQKKVVVLPEGTEISEGRLERELKKLYDSEINISITSFWDGGWYVKLGDHVNGWKDPDWDTCELHDIVGAIRDLAKEHYPNSTYVKNLKS